MAEFWGAYAVKATFCKRLQPQDGVPMQMTTSTGATINFNDHPEFYELPIICALTLQARGMRSTQVVKSDKWTRDDPQYNINIEAEEIRKVRLPKKMEEYFTVALVTYNPPGAGLTVITV